MNSLMLDYVSTAIVIFDDGFNCVDCNNSALEIFRFDNKTTFLKNFFRTMPPFQASGMPSVDVFKKLLRATMKNEEIRLEIVCQRADGILIPAELTLKRAYHEHKFVIIASFYNLTKIKSEYKKNVSTSEIAQLYLSSSPLAMELFNDQYRIIDCNQQALALLDFPNKNEYMKRTAPNAAEFLYHDIYTQAQDKENFFRALTDGAVRYEWVFQKRDGTKLPCEITRIRITGPDRIFVVSYIHDLSTVKAMAEELKKAESIERENRAKNQFLAQVSHVLRTPLNLISGVTEMQLQRNYSTETENSFLQIKKSSEELIRVIDNILDLSNAYSDEFFIDSKKIFTADFISEISQNINEKNFSLEADENLPQIFFGDEKRLQQIIFAFLNRAFKYDTHVTLKIFFDENSLAFNIFSAQKFQPDEMNFALTRRLVELMHGEIFVGANFFAKIPVEHEDEIIGAETAKKLQTIETKENKKFEYEPMPYGKVLVVDDVDTNLYVALQLLKPYGISAQTASSGADALQKIKNGAFFDIIFMDHMMPELDGIQTAKAIRRTGCDFPIVALTANVILGQADLFEKNGFAGFISKPIDV
ncbi:MAG: response regulator, partial [Defluviitaleaceae bacterium]|nr:response regulator [Defluviitaleaceae bacterium]